MYEPWQPLGRDLESWPGLDISIEHRTVKITLSNWRSEICVFAMQFVFTHGVVGMHVWDERIPQATNLGMPADEEFCAYHRGYPVWVDRTGSRLGIYGEYASTIYKQVDSYVFYGQSTVVVLDVADTEPLVVELSPSDV